jgi:cadmium resistance protein CadD (predicted permease)
MFVATNVDDMIILTVLFLASRSSGRPKVWQIWAGQYVGVAALVAVSVLAALGLTLVPDDWVGLLGLLPFALGVYGLVEVVRNSDDDEAPTIVSGTLAVAGVTVANGADNIAVYTPVFRTVGAGATTVTIVVFAAGIAVWCLAASWMGSHKRIIKLVERYGEAIVPVAFMLIGAVIVIESGVLTKLL